MLMLAFCFAACSDEEEDNVVKATDLGFTFNSDMIQVSGLDEACTVSVNNSGRIVEISLVLADADKLSALDVSIVGLPDGATASPASFTGDFTSGKTVTVAISNNGFTANYVFAASASGNPYFVSFTLDNIEPVNGVATLLYGTDLSYVVVDYTVYPENTTVTANGTVIKSGSSVDFSDVDGGVVFGLTFGEQTSTMTYYAAIEGVDSIFDILLRRVWGEYTATNGSDGTLDVANWCSIALDDEYMYLPTATAAGGMTAISIADQTIKKMSTSGMSGGTHLTSQALVVKDGSSTKLLVCNLANGQNDNIKVYSYDSVDSDPELVLEYTPGKARYGDKLTIEGDWQSGRLLFWNASATYRGEVLAFNITNGVIDGTPTELTVPSSVHNGLASYAGVYHYSGNEYLLAGAGIYLTAMTLAEGATEFVYEAIAPSYAFHYAASSAGTENPTFFTATNGTEYMAYAQIEGNYDICIYVEDMDRDTFAENISNMRYGDTLVNNGLYFDLGNPNGLGLSTAVNSNHLAGLDVRTINGTTYIAGVAPEVGIALYRVIPIEK